MPVSPDLTDVTLQARHGAFTPASTTVEQTLAVVRVATAIAGLALLWMDPLHGGSARGTVTGLLTGYGLFAILAGAGLRVLPEVGWAFAVGTHLIDVAVAAAVTLLADSPSSPFFLFLNLPVVTAAYRWGLVEAVSTAMLTLSLLALESLLVPASATLALAPSRPFVRALYVGVLALTAGSLAEHDKRQRREAVLIARLLGTARFGHPFGETLDLLLAALARAFRSRRAVIVMQHVRTGRCFLQAWPAALGRGTAARPSPRELPQPVGDDYWFGVPGLAAYAARRPFSRSRYVARGVDAAGHAFRRTTIQVSDGFVRQVASRRLLIASQQFHERWNVRIFLEQVPMPVSPPGAARRLQRVIAAVGPALFAQFRAMRVGQRAAQAERARIVRDLHDGPVQSLLGVEMELAVLRRRATTEAPGLAADLGRFHQTLKHEVIGLREVFEGVRAGATPNRPIQHDLSDLMSRFAIYTGLDARYVGDHDSVLLPPGTRRELLRITHEALANIRKHSGARRVVLRSDVQPGHLVLTIEDNGRGFSWAGVRTHAELRAAHEGPWTILERTAMINATLTITSKPGSGATLELLVPTPATAAAGPRAVPSSPGVLV